jgi:hypothetical protein
MQKMTEWRGNGNGYKYKEYNRIHKFARTQKGQANGSPEMVGPLHVVLNCGECAMATVGEHDSAKAHEKPGNVRENNGIGKEEWGHADFDGLTGG